MWKQLSQAKKPTEFAFVPGSSKIVRFGGTYAWIQAKFTFSIAGPPECVCSGYIGLVPESESGWKIWLLTTMFENLTKDNVVMANNNAIQEAGLGSFGHTATSTATVGALDNSHHECVIVGAGFSGLCVAGRLKAMGVSCLILESNPKVGDNWVDRYESVCYHTSKIL
ncbi:flavin-containing protein [Fusarium phyllophilum]|uniref:Flavin-containing protein n=1 Tax=Fusarium phyllophilum TaxID=47803 RepID=A0A8H5JTD3_9HYPO|nr:flavin-containing protein [Fusarium phyllophilum]